MGNVQRPDSSDVVLTPETGHVRITPVGFWVRAKEFLDAGDLLSKDAGRMNPVSAFLFCRASELALKSFLLARGTETAVVKSLNHDLKKILVEAHARGIDTIIPLIRADKSSLMEINEAYVGHKLAYFDISVVANPLTGPQFEALPTIARKLVEGVKQGCLESADGKWKPF